MERAIEKCPSPFPTAMNLFYQKILFISGEFIPLTTPKEYNLI